MKNLYLVFIVCIFSVPAKASFFDHSLTLLLGDNYKVEPAEQYTLTYEAFYANQYGDAFLFIDRKHFGNDKNSRYGEFSPRVTLFSFNKGNVIKSVLFSTTFERGKNDVKSDLYGVAVDFAIPGFDFFKSNVYQRDNKNIPGKSKQLTQAWRIKFSLWERDVVFDGYIDWVFSSDENHKNIHFNPQLKWLLSDLCHADFTCYAGIEYDYWDHKFGIEDRSTRETEQNTASLIFKVHF